MPLPTEVRELVERFERNRDSYTSTGYNETQVRREFLDPFFTALGWDVENKAGNAEAYKDVIHEDAVKIGGATKAPDYSFRIGGTRKFFVEAKKPAVNLKDDPGPAYQLRRYAWSAKLPISVLSSFDELAVYDCRSRPDATDKASNARVLYLTSKDYESKWDEIAATFSKEAVLKGSFDKYAESKKGKRGTTTVDAAFLESIEGWRDSLARNLAIRNPKISQRDLNYAVGKTIDRVIFLRICEDRGIERYGRLQGLTNGSRIYPRLAELFEEADARFNSGLFHFRDEKEQSESPDEWTLRLSLDDKVLKEILGSLYYPESPYEFSVLPAEILGQVYEQFLGKVIRLTSGHQAKVEDKPEVKKAGGVYYTPAYIVDYIVKNTVGKLLDGKTPKQASKLRVLDPACGSGSFLIGAYRVLLDWHRARYVTDDPKKHTKELYQGPGGDWRLTSEEKRRILLNNIYGVDIDAQAVEVTKLSLLLKVLEGESDETISSQAKLFHQRALPNLGKNIKCGNSLIGPDFYKGQQALFLDDDERYRVNAFDWEQEFPDIMKAGGFDAVIGNPPWGAGFKDPDKEYLDSIYHLNSGKYESYVFFIEKATNLTKQRGMFGFIVPSYWASRSQMEGLRFHLTREMKPQAFIVLPENVFEGVQMDSCLLVASKDREIAPGSAVFVADLGFDRRNRGQTADSLMKSCHQVALEDWNNLPRLRFNPRILDRDIPVIGRIESEAILLGDIVEITQGLTLYRKSTLEEEFGTRKAKEIMETRAFHSTTKKNATFKKEIGGSDVSRYAAVWNGQDWVSYGPWLAHAVDEKFFQGPRLVAQKLRNPTLRDRLVVGFLDDKETYSAGTLLNLILKKSSDYSLLYLLALLNSNLLNFWYRKCVIDVSIRVADLKLVPIHPIAFADRTGRARHDKLSALAEKMLTLHEKARSSKTPSDGTVFERQIAATDRQIDELVYELYGLTEEEIKIVEGATP